MVAGCAVAGVFALALLWAQGPDDRCDEEEGSWIYSGVVCMNAITFDSRKLSSIDKASMKSLR